MIDLSPRALAILLLAMTLAVGLLGGVLLDRTLLRPAPGAVLDQPAIPFEGAGASRTLGPREEAAESRRFLLWMVRELDITREQRRQIDSILIAQRAALREVSESFRPRYREVMAEAQQGIRRVLNDEQARRLRALMDSTRREGRTGGGSQR